MTTASFSEAPPGLEAVLANRQRMSPAVDETEGWNRYRRYVSSWFAWHGPPRCVSPSSVSHQRTSTAPSI